MKLTQPSGSHAERRNRFDAIYEIFLDVTLANATMDWTIPDYDGVPRDRRPGGIG